MTLARCARSLCLASILAITATAAADAAQITVMGYRGEFQENYTRAVIEPFQAAHPDITVTYYGVQNAATALGLMRAQKDAPQVDAVIFDLSVAKIARDEGLIAEAARLTNLAKLGDLGRDLGAFAPPITYDTLALLYNAGTFPAAPTSWTALWDKGQAGKIIVPAQGGGDIQAIALTLIANRMAGAEDYRQGVGPGVDKLVEMAPLIQTWEPKPDAYTLVANGTATLAIGWNARSQFYADQTEGRLGSVAPAEGTITQVNVISLIANSPNREAAETFMDYALGAEAQQRFSQAMFYAPSNKDAAIPPETGKRIPLLDPAQKAKLVPIDWMTIGDMRESILAPWRRQIIPASR